MGWWANEAELRLAVERWGSPTTAAREIGGISERRCREAWRILQSGQDLPPASSASSSENTTDVHASATITDTTATLISAANPRGTAAMTPEEMLEVHGLDPAEWDYRVSASSWDALCGDGSITTLHRIKVDAVRRIEALVMEMFSTDWRPPKPKHRRVDDKPHLIVLFADPHFPLHEPALYQASLAWLDEFQPERIVCLGDEGNWSPFSRHTPNPRTDNTVQEAIWGTYQGLAGWRSASPNALMELFPGNHTKHLEKRLLELFPAAMKVTRAGESEPLISMRNILRLDELHITYHDTSGEYHDAVREIIPGLVGMHGTKTGKHGGAAKEQEGWEGTSVIVGHDHKLVLTSINKRTSDGNTQRYAISCGTMARRDLGYNPAQDVGQGWSVVTLHPCGRWHIDMALYDPETESTTWRGWIWKP